MLQSSTITLSPAPIPPPTALPLVAKTYQELGKRAKIHFVTNTQALIINDFSIRILVSFAT
jgi:hypothetical protein